MSAKLKDTTVRLTNLFGVLSEELNDYVPKEASKAFAVQRQVQRMRKRAWCDDRKLHDQAISDFICTNALVGSVVVSLPSVIVSNAKHLINTVLENFTTNLTGDIQQSLDPSFLYDNWRFGPGASNGVSGTHTAEKITQDMTSTILCKPFVTILRKYNTYFQLIDERKGSDGIAVVKGSRLTTVPKNETTHRTIAIEPSGNMALQLAAGMYLEGALRSIGLDIRSQQPKNKLLALSGSITDDLATIDLKSASDMFTPELVRLLLPERWYKLLMCLRSEYIELPDGEQLKLNMISTMGNGFTFPLMTLIITALVYANRCTRKGSPSLFIDWNRTCIFGDDIIIPSDEYASLTCVLESAGLVVNHDKSYASGPFRESCGGDFYEGYDVTPFYIKSLATDSDVYVALNQVMEWSARHNVLLPRTMLFLKSCLRGKVLLVPEWHNPDQGFLTAHVSRRYKHLYVLLPKKKLRDQTFLMMLACGGYIDGSSPDVTYTPRQRKNEVRVRKSTLPNGYLDGSCPLKRSVATTEFVRAYTFLMDD